MGVSIDSVRSRRTREIADLLENIAEQGVDYFYKGKVAKQIVDLINDRGGCFDVSDMESYEPKFREPVKTTYRGYEVCRICTAERRLCTG